MSSYSLQQLNDGWFLSELVEMLKTKKDLSRIDLRVMDDQGMHRRYNALVKNYEINIMRTPVFAYPTKLRRFLCWGCWCFEPEKYERYEIFVSENAYDKRKTDSPLPDLDNNILITATMASNLGIYLDMKRFVNERMEVYKKLCLQQNPQIFNQARDLYNILEVEYLHRQQNLRRYELPEIKTSEDLYNARIRMLSCVQRQL